jgi:enoyl-CoA hydratase/carnithine racemase
MKYLDLNYHENIANVTLRRGKVNAINGDVIDELSSCFKGLAKNDNIKAVILTGTGAFFSFGFDIPEFLKYKKADFHTFLIKFTEFYTYLFLFPKPVIALLNGHAIAGGCMLALACDYRIMGIGNPKISLNEIQFGSTVFAGSVEMLRFCAGSRNAEQILYSGAMYSAEEALELSFIHEAVSEKELNNSAMRVATLFSLKKLPAFSSIKYLLRKPIVEIMVKKEQDSVIDLVDIWYSEETRKQIQKINIR